MWKKGAFLSVPLFILISRVIEKGKDMQELTRSDELALEFDPRLAEIWAAVFTAEPGLEPEKIGWFLRMAYLRGYQDALTESRRGELFTSLGLPIPRRERQARRKGATA